MADKPLDERLADLYQKRDRIDQFYAADVKTIIDAIRDAREHGGTASVDITPLVEGGGYKIIITDSEGVAHDAEVRDGGDAYTVYVSTVPQDQTPMSKTAWLASLKGADGQNGEPGNNGHNPCLGRFNVLPTLFPNPFSDARAGDYLYYDTTDQQDNPVTYIYHFDGTDWDSEGTLVDVSNLSFRSGQSVTGVAIKNLDGNNDPDAAGVLSAEAGRLIADTTMQHMQSVNLLNPADIQIGVRLNSSGNTVSASNDYYGCTNFVEIGEGVIVNHTVLSGSGTGHISACMYDSSKKFIGWVTGATSAGGIRIITNNTNVQGTPEDGADTTDKFYVRFNLYDPTSTEGGVAYNGVTDGYAVYRGTELPSSPYQPYVAPYWKIKDVVPADNTITTPKIVNGAVTIEKLTDIIEQWGSANLFNKNDSDNVYNDGIFINRTTGAIGNNSSYSGGISHYIPITEEGLYSTVTFDRGSGGYCLYDESLNPIQGSGGTGHIVRYVEGAAYARFTFPKDVDPDSIMINIGSVAKEYESYVGKIKKLSPSILPSAGNNYKLNAKIILPSNIYVTKGDIVRFYKKSTINIVNPDNVEFTMSSGDIKVARFTQRYALIDVGKEGAYAIEFALYDSDMSLVDKKNVSINVIDIPDEPNNPVSILLVGASRQADGKTLKELIRRLTASDGNPEGIGLTKIKTVGHETSVIDGVDYHHCAHKGHTMQSLVEAGDISYDIQLSDAKSWAEGEEYSYTNGAYEWVFEIISGEPSEHIIHCKKISGNGDFATVFGGISTENPGILYASDPLLNDLTFTGIADVAANPFWNINKVVDGVTTPGIDFGYYVNTYCAGQLESDEKISIVIISRVQNDLKYTSPSGIISYYKTFIDEFKSYNPNGKVIINTDPLPSLNGIGIGTSRYKIPRASWYGYANTLFKVYEQSFELAESDEYKDFVEIAATAMEFDTENLYGKWDYDTDNRSGKIESLEHDALHYSDAGKNVVADSLYHVTCKMLNDINNVE